MVICLHVKFYAKLFVWACQLIHPESLITHQVLKYFCETCDEAICRDCAIYEHREHIYVDLREAVKKYRSSITALQDRTKRKIPVLRAAVDEVREVTYELHERVEMVRNTIRDSIQRHIRALEEQERELIGQLEDISTSKEKVRLRIVIFIWKKKIFI